MSGVDPYDWELRYPSGRPPTTRAVQLSLDGLILFEGATAFELKKLEVINLYNFLVAHRETFLQKNEKQAHRR